MAYGGLSDVAFITKNKASPVTITVKLTNANNSATSLFTLEDTNGKKIGATTKQATKASFVVPPSELVPAPATLELALNPVSLVAGNITVWIEAFQDGAPLQVSKAGVPTDQDHAGVNVGSVPPSTDCGSNITLL